MPFNVLLLPLLGGFVFISRWRKVKYKALRLDGHRLLFSAAIHGIWLLALAELLVVVSSSLFPSVVDFWNLYSPFEYSGRAMLAFVLGLVIPLLFNSRINEDKEIDKVIEEREDPLELLLRGAMGERRMVSLTVKNGKVYVGFVTSNFNPVLPMQSVAILPAMSGHRDEKMRVVFTTQYSQAYEGIREEISREVLGQFEGEDEIPADIDIDKEIGDRVDRVMKDFELVIPVAEIQSANIFDIKAYKKYFEHVESEEAAETQTGA